MKRILIFIRGWRRARVLRQLAKVDLQLQVLEYGYEATLWEDEECEIEALRRKMLRLEAKLERLL